MNAEDLSECGRHDFANEVLVFRQDKTLEGLKSSMSGGVPINKINHFRPLLEKDGQRLTGRQHPADLMLLVHDKERHLVKEPF